MQYTMATSYSDRDLDLIPSLTFTFVENYVQAQKKSSGQKSMNKGLKYFSEGYIQELRVKPVENGCEVSGKCFRSQRKNDTPHQIKVKFNDTNKLEVANAGCTCPIGMSAACGHIVGTLYQLAKYKILGQRAIPADISKTSQPQTWHVPRGEKIQGMAVQDLQISGYSSKKSVLDTPSTANQQHIKSTLFNPIRGKNVNWEAKHDSLSSVAPDLLILPALIQNNVPAVMSKFGKVPQGSVLSVQQKLENEYVLNIFDGVAFPSLPFKNKMKNNLNTVLTNDKNVVLEGLKISMHEITKFEEQTRLQSKTPLWHQIRKHRLTASKVGDVFKRKKNHDTLVKRFKSTRNITTAAMARGIACEPIAAEAYAIVKDGKVNLYPCGVVVNFWAPWLAASPDRKVYNPEMFHVFGLLEIKCPQKELLETEYLSKDNDGILKLKRNHSYYYQVLTQLAVTGLYWCDFFVWCPNDHHLETIYFNEDVWQEVKTKLDIFYFHYFL